MTSATRVTNICAALASLLEAALLDLQVEIDRAAPPNEDANRTPWVGIYRSRTEFESRTVGLGAGHRRQTDTLLVIAQEADGTSGAECEARLETLVSGILDAVLSDPSINGTVAMLEDVEVAYDEYSMIGDEFFQSASITLRVQTVTT